MSGQPRIIYNSSGADISSSVQSILLSNRNLLMADMFWLKVYNSWAPTSSTGSVLDLQFTSGNEPIQVDHVQTGINGNLTSTATVSGITGGQTWLSGNPPYAIKRDKLSFKVGFEDNPFSLTIGATPSNVSFLLPYDLAIITPGATGIGAGGYGPGTAIGFATYPGDWVQAPHVHADLNVGVLLCAFVNGSGALVGSPMYVGVGPTTTYIAPAGTTNVTLGPNGGSTFSSNSGLWNVKWSSSSGASGQVIIPGTTNPWINPGIGNTYGYAQSSAGTSPVSIPANPGDTFIFSYVQKLSIQQILVNGYADGSAFWYHKAIFDPTSGAFLGTTLMFRGYLRDVETADDHTKLTIASLMENFNQVKIPTQLIQPGNRSVQIEPPQSTQVLGNVLGTSTPTDLQFSASAADHLFQGGFIITGGYSTYGTNNPKGGFVPTFIRIRDNITTSGVLHLYPMEPILVALSSLSPVAAWALSSLDNSNGAPGFPYVPGPDKA